MKHSIINILFGVAAYPLFTCLTAPEVPHLKLGTPQRQLFRADREGYSVEFDRLKHMPTWVSYRVTPDDLAVEFTSRPAFTADTELPAECRAIPLAYNFSGMDKGHLAPFRDLNSTDRKRRESMLLSNVVPQAPGLNRGAWRRLEEEVRERARASDESIIITGAVAGWELCDLAGGNGVAIPGSLWKACAFRLGAQWEVKSWYAANYDDANVYERPLKEVERIAGLQMFPLLREP